MRTRASLAAIVAAGIWAASAAAANPAQIYNDYVRSGHLSCSYSHDDLEALLRSGSINQYGDPLTLARLKLAARRHLAGSCLASGTSRATGASGQSTSEPPTEQTPSRSRHQKRHPGQLRRSPRFAAGASASVGGSNSSFLASRALIVGLLAVALAFAGWLTKRALSARD